MTTTTKCRFNATSRDECPRPVACDIHNDNLPTYTVETLATTWNMRLLFPHETDTEFAERLAAMQVPNALDMVTQARLYAYETNKIKSL